MPNQQPYKEGYMEAADQVVKLHAENERIQAAAQQREVEVARLTGERDGWKRGSELHEQRANKAEAEIERLRAALTEIMQGARNVDYAIHLARVALANAKEC